MVVYSTKIVFDKEYGYARSDEHLYIADADGHKYVDVIYPLGDPRTFTETDEKIPESEDIPE